jgi:sugar O-acyltransferase (sialic acid O-acetyltransferase NeuD family)
MNKKLAILGAGGHGKVVADAALLCSDWDEISFFDDAFPAKKINGPWSISGNSNDLLITCNDFDGVIIAIGNNSLRLAKTRELIKIGARIVSIIHPQAIISPFASIGFGNVVFAGAIINVDVSVGDACIINTGAVIEHDCQLNHGVHISPNATLAGKTIIDECSWIGAASVTKELIVIGSNVVVGAGSVVIKSIANGLTVVGNPAKILIKN